MVPTQQNANKRSQAGNVTIGVVPRECAGSRPCWGEGFLFAFFPSSKVVSGSELGRSQPRPALCGVLLSW